MPHLHDEADFVIVGTGAGGATAARVLSEAGRSVIMLEEGPHLTTDGRPRDILGAMAQSFRDFGTTTTRGPFPLPLLQGRCVGGSTAINCGIVWRLPEDVRDDWRLRFGLGELVGDGPLGRVFETLEGELDVAQTGHDVLGGNGSLMEVASRALDLPGQPMRRNAAHCRGRAQCLQGCPGEARQSMDVSYVPRAIARGARLHALARAEQVTVERGHAVGVSGVTLDPATRRPRGHFEVRARLAVIAAGGAVQTPLLLRRTGLRRNVGDRFQAHPGLGVLGRFPFTVGMGFGATQGYEVPLRERGFKLESLSIPPELLASRLPGAGAEWEDRIGHLDEFAQWVALIRMKAVGRVRPSFGGAPSVTYEPGEEDMARARDATALLCRMLFAAGAVEVYPGVAGLPEVITSPAEVEAIERRALRPGDVHFSASHLFGTACASADPAVGVVGPDLQCHELPGLYVMDASCFPTNLGVNPQHSIMALAWRGAERLAEQDRSVRTLH